MVRGTSFTDQDLWAALETYPEQMSQAPQATPETTNASRTKAPHRVLGPVYKTSPKMRPDPLSTCVQRLV